MLKAVRFFLERRRRRRSRKKAQRLRIVEFVEGGYQTAQNRGVQRHSSSPDKPRPCSEAVQMTASEAELGASISPPPNDLNMEQAHASQTKDELHDYGDIESTFKHRCDKIISSVLQNTSESIQASDMDKNTMNDKFEDAIRYAEYQLKSAEYENNE
ncbi:hypothetical protein GCK32_020582, partial [Trichostrongylus colubriformis]